MLPYQQSALNALNKSRKEAGKEEYITADKLGLLWGLSESAVRMLAHGFRSNKPILKLPSQSVIVGGRLRVLLLLSEAETWKITCQYRKNSKGRAPSICPHCGKKTAKRTPKRVSAHANV